MSKIQRIKFINFKAISSLDVDFKGCTAILTGGNDKGKTSFLRGIPDRCRFLRPEVKVRRGEANGSGEMILTTGETFQWEFDNEGKDRFMYIPEKGKKPISVTVELGQRFFKPLFDIDKFLQSSPREQVKELQKVVGVDFTDVNNRYKIAYDIRSDKNLQAEKFHVKLTKMLEVPKVEKVDLTLLQNKKEEEEGNIEQKRLANKAHNDGLRQKWNDRKSQIDKEIASFNTHQKDKKSAIDKMESYRKRITDVLEESEDLMVLVNLDALHVYISKLPKPEPYKTAEYPAEPEYIEEMPDKSELRRIEAEILTASDTNTQAQAYLDYVNYKRETEIAKEEAEEADKKVKEIEEERKRLIESANFPKGVSINAEGVEVDGFPLDKRQISTSKLYTTALRIAAMNLGEVKTLYFDASFLDKITLGEIEAWANEHDLQLLIERPDYDGGEIKYQLIEEN